MNVWTPGLGWIVAITVLSLAATADEQAKTFDQDVAFLQQHVGTDVLRIGPNGPLGPAIAVVADYQRRVMTSTAGAEQQNSYGWINYAHIESGEVAPHINVYGGEERFWLGPEGGQYALFFPADNRLTDAGDHVWTQKPAPLDLAVGNVQAWPANSGCRAVARGSRESARSHRQRRLLR